MKYLQVYEAFESNAITKTFNFLKDKKIDVINFKKSLLEFQSFFDYPLSDIEDNNVKYLKYKKAIHLKNEENVNNKFGIYCVKYWFSLENGYLGNTITGNMQYEFNPDNNLTFSAVEFNFIKDKLDIKTGLLTTVNDYTILKTGDKVILELLIEEDEDGIITDGIIYIIDNEIYVIQNRHEGLYPKGSEWREYGKYGWIIYKNGNISDDHAHLHLYTKSTDELNYSYKTIEEEKYLEYNLPSYNFTPQRWNKIFINDADFAIVLMVDDILKEKKAKSAIYQERKWAKSGATKLISDSDIRQSNILKYNTAVISKMVNKDTGEFSNLQKILIKYFCGKYILFSVISNTSYISIMKNNLVIKLNNIKNNKDDIDYYIAILADFYKEVENTSIIYTKLFEDSLHYAKTFNNDSIKFTMYKLEEMSNKVYNYLQAQNIKTIENLNELLDKIININNYFFDKYTLDYNTIYILKNFYNTTIVKRKLSTYYISPIERNKNTESILKIQKIINSDFKIDDKDVKASS